MSPIASVTGLPAQIQRGLVAAERVFAVMDSMPSVPSGEKTVAGLRTQFEVKNMSFKYNDTPGLQDITFMLQKGKKLALVGPSGGGKSTMVDIIARFYDPYQGEVLLDGENIRNFTLDSYRPLFGIVSASALLFIAETKAV